MINYSDVLVFFVTISILAYTWCKINHNYWKRRKVFNVPENWFLGCLYDIARGKCHLGEKFTKLYVQHKDKPYIGVYLMQTPTLVVNDVALIKNILIKDFIHFTDHLFVIHEEAEPIAQHLFNLKGEVWKNFRNRLSPTFTPNKVKFMFDTIHNCALEMDKYLEREVAKHVPLDLKEIMAKLNTDIIGSCAFGLECNSFKYPDAEFRMIGKEALTNDGLKKIMATLYMIPCISKRLKVSLFGKRVTDFFYNTVKDNMAYRRKNGVSRNDFIQILMQLQDYEAKNVEPEKRITVMQMAATSFVFFIAGFEGASTATSCAFLELARNPEIQETLREDIENVLRKHDEKITFESVGEMTYLTKVVEETLRKYPSIPVVFRLCTKEYTIPGTDITIEKDTPVIIPAYGLQFDPQYFPDPEKFDPERFSSENKALRDPVTYLPFGEGPRVCIGARFAMLQCKIGILSIIRKYKISICEKTEKSIELDNTSFLLMPKNGVWLNLTKLK